jgi:sigma-54-specific transcriptional regulator
MSLTTLHHKAADLPRSAGPTTAVVRPPGAPEFERADSPTLIAFRESQQLSLLIRATAFVFSDPQ